MSQDESDGDAIYAFTGYRKCKPVMTGLKEVVESLVSTTSSKQLEGSMKDVQPNQVAELCMFEEFSPWASSPLRSWFESNWSKKPLNALCMLKSRIDATFMLKFWRYRCRVAVGGNTNPDVLVLVAFWDRSLDPVYAIGASSNSGLACKAALVDLWPQVQGHITCLIDIAEAREKETNARIDAMRSSSKPKEATST